MATSELIKTPINKKSMAELYLMSAQVLLGMRDKDAEERDTPTKEGKFDMVLTEAERAQIRLILSRSSPGSAKYEGAVKSLGKSQLSFNPLIVSVPPTHEEEIYHRHFFITNPTEVAAIKACHDSGFDAKTERLHHIESTVEYLNQLGIQQNTIGTRVFSLASDILATEEQGKVMEFLHKPEGIKTREDAYQHLRRIRGSLRPHKMYKTDKLGREQPIMQLGYRAGLASFELISQTGATSLREIKTLQLEASDDFLLALVFGYLDPRVSEHTRLMFHNVYTTHLETGRVADLCGYTPVEGLPMDKLQKVNAGWKDDCAFIASLLMLEIDGVSHFDRGFQAKLAEFRDISRGYPNDAQQLLQRHTQLLSRLENDPRSVTHYAMGEKRLAAVLNRECEPGNRLLVGDWYDLSREVEVSPETYLAYLMSQFLVDGTESDTMQAA